MKNEIAKNKLLYLIIFLILSAGVIYRFIMLQRSFEYDEIWTLRNYMQLPFFAVFTDLSTPNNHPLHTLLVQWALAFSGDNIFLVRLPAFLFGIAIPIAGAMITWKFTKQKAAVLLTAAALTFHAHLIYYSHTARGYTAQTFFVLLSAAALIQISRGKQKTAAGILFFISAVCSCLCITSGLLFICALCGAFLIMMLFDKKRKNKTVSLKTFVIPAAAFFLFAAAWYGCNFHRISAGQSFGSNVWNPLDFLKFCCDVSSGILLFPFLLIHIAGCIFLKGSGKKIAIANILFTCLVFLSALVTKAGPVRVYLPMFPVLAVGAAMVLSGFCREWKREILLPVSAVLAGFFLICCPFMQKKIVPPDWFRLADEIIRDLPPEILVNYGPHDSYAAVNNHMQAKEDLVKRLSTIPLKGFLQINTKGTIDVYDMEKGTPVSFSIPALQTITSRDGTPMNLYHLVPLSPASQTKGKPVLLTIIPVRISQYQVYSGILRNFSDQWYLTNLFLNHKRYAPDGEEIKASAVFTPSAKQNAAEYLTLTERSQGTFRFYTLEGSPLL